MPYGIETNEEVKSSQKRSKIFKKLETESGEVEYIPEIIQDEFYIDNFNDKKINQEKEEKKSYCEEERTIFDLVKIKDVFNESKILNLEMTSYNSNDLKNNKIINTNEEIKKNNCKKKKINIQINPLGYFNSKRKKDGITYFGYQKDESEKENDIDIKINPIDNEYIDDKYFGRHFQIKFNPNDKQYYLKDLGHGFGTFIKIIDWVEIKNNFLLNIGENYLVFSIGIENDIINENYIIKNINNEIDNYLNVKIFSSNSKQNNLIFTPSDSPFTIGRKEENAIYIEDNMLSRIHCTIKYKNKKWYIIDGNANEQNKDEESRRSTNGSWLYAYEDCLIINKMIFKASHYLFECNLINKKDEDKS